MSVKFIIYNLMKIKCYNSFSGCLSIDDELSNRFLEFEIGSYREERKRTLSASVRTII